MAIYESVGSPPIKLSNSNKIKRITKQDDGSMRVEMKEGDDIMVSAHDEVIQFFMTHVMLTQHECFQARDHVTA